MNSKSQINVEFFILMGLVFLVALSFELASLDQLNDFRAQKESEAVKDIALKLQKELLIAAAVEDGYVRIFEMPNKLDSINYSLIMQNSTIAVQSKNGYYFVAIPQAIGNFTKGTNKINKTGGVIHIN
ncbi:hypothetical protein HYX02_01415 [Candidatus Woesearchaeota archaeon]|nr:hypothetical protein [Candidatus Woesearchaeota archaeon]